MEFVHLNVKSEYTLLNGIIKTRDLIEKVKSFDKKAIAITDLNNMYNVFHFEEQLNKNGIKYIIGVTFSLKYSDDVYGNIELLAKDLQGYKNLVKLATLANQGNEHVGAKGFPFLNVQDLEGNCAGLICLTGGTSGISFQYFLEHDYEKIAALLDTYIHYFGAENVYVEFQNHLIDSEHDFLTDEKIRELIQERNLETVATNDAYYLETQHAYHRGLALKMNPNPERYTQQSTYVDFNNEWYLKTPEEMQALFAPYLSLYPNLLTNTVKIATLCNAKVPVEKVLPKFPIPSGYTNETYLRFLCEAGFEERFAKFPVAEKQKYRKRLDYEFEVIKKMGFIDYHLITADFIQWAKDDKVYEHPQRYFPPEYYPDYSVIPDKLWKKDYEILVGPGRGSAAGSLLCYCLKITNLDPIKDGLLFERFLNVERVSMPDIDIDFPNAYRYDVVEYVQSKYGYDKVAQIATFQTLGVKSIIKSVGKALNIPFSVTNEMTKNIPDKYLVQEEDEEGNIQTVEKKIELLSQLENYDYFKKRIETDTKMAELFAIGKVLEGLPSSTGKHAAGVIIGRRSLMNYMPLMEVDGVMVTQFEKKAAESIGMLKMDFLGLQTLDVLTESLKLIDENHGKKIDIYAIPLDDTETFEKVFQTANTGKIFQFESEGMKRLLKRMKPKSVADLCAACAAYRPGPMQFIDEFIVGRNNPEEVHYPTKEYEMIAKDTCGILFYQEQIMQLVQAMAGFSLGEADILRRGIAKKEKKYIDEGRERFISGCLRRHTADKKTAEHIYSTIEKFANYGFNKSHSAAYALIAYLCGYLKAHYPECFMSANLTVCSHDVKKLAYALSETKKSDITILPPDIRYSQNRFIIEKKGEEKAIRFSLAAIKSIREENAALYKAVPNKNSFYEFIKGIPTASLRKNQLLNLIYAGALDYLGTRKDLAENLGKMMELAKFTNSLTEKEIPNVLSFISPTMNVTGFEFQLLDKLRKEKDTTQIALSGHPISAVRNLVTITHTLADLQPDIYDTGSDKEKLEVEIAGLITDLKIIQTKKGENMAFCRIEDEFYSASGIIFPKDFVKISDDIDELLEIPVLIKATVKWNENEDFNDGANLIIQSVEKIIKNNYTIFINKDDLSESLIQTMSNMNGIGAVIAVNLDEKTVTRLPFSVDINPRLIGLLNKNSVKYCVKR